jgi:hypothetical protein
VAHRAAVRRGCGVGQFDDALENTVLIVHHVTVPKPKQTVTAIFEILVSHHIALAVRMLAAV